MELREPAIETHLSRLYFEGDRVFKVKKAVDLGFADFSTLAKRKHACEEEVRLNRRLAEGIYHGVVPILGEDGKPVEYAVEMTRLPEARMLDAMLERGEIDALCIERIAKRLATFHAGAERGPDVDRHASPAAVAERVLGNLVESRRDTEALPARVADLLEGAVERFVREQKPRFEQRVAARRICEGHGDLHAGNVCVLPDRIVAFDCIEFSRPLRCLDVAADLAFLLMDLDRLGFPAFGQDLARRYAEATKDPELHGLLAFYKAHLACVRGKVAELRGRGMAEAEADARAKARLEALRFFALAASYATPPFLVFTCGLPGSGKSHVAREVARALDARHVQSDIERKVLAGLVPGTPPPPVLVSEVYSDAMTKRTYERLIDEARTALSSGRRVVLDGTYPTAAFREEPLQLARELDVPVVLVACQVDDGEARRRLVTRAGRAGEFSDADVAVFERAKERFQPPTEVASERRVDVGADSAGDEVVMSLLERVVGQLDRAGKLPVTFPAGQEG